MENLALVSPQKKLAQDLDILEVEWRKIDSQDYSKSPFCNRCHRKDFMKGKGKEREEYCKMDFVADSEDQEVRKGIPVKVSFTRMWKCPYCFGGKAIIIPLTDYKKIESEGGK